MIHVLGSGTWKLEGSFDGVEVLVLEDGDHHTLELPLSETREGFALLRLMRMHLKVKQLTDIIDEYKGNV